MSIDLADLPRRARAGAAILFLATATCVHSPPPTAWVTIPPIPAGEARVWFYRPIDAYDSMATPYIRMNDTIVAVSMPEGASYRDVPPGPYHITVDSYGKELQPGQECSARCWPRVVRQGRGAARLG